MRQPSWHVTSGRRRTGADATLSRRIDVSATSFRRHVPAGKTLVKILGACAHCEDLAKNMLPGSLIRIFPVAVVRLYIHK